jgi:hypothetical protein
VQIEKRKFKNGGKKKFPCFYPEFVVLAGIPKIVTRLLSSSGNSNISTSSTLTSEPGKTVVKKIKF